MNTHHCSKLPLCRPKMLPDEWIETYLFRVSRANGIRHPRLSDAERIRPTLPATASSKSDGYPIWSDSTLPRWSVVTRANKIRYCPECMAQSRHIRSRWRLTVFDVCTIHHIRLKDDLAEPVMTRGYKQEKIYSIADVTDEQLWAGAVCPMPSERRHLERLWSGFEQSIIENDLPGAFEQLTNSLFLEALLDALATTTQEFECSPVGVPRSTCLAELVDKFGYLLAPNLDGIRNFLNQINEPSHRAVVLARLRRMLIDEAHRPTCFSKLPIGNLRKQFRMGLPEDVKTQDHRLPHPSHAQSVEYVSLRKAASLVGCSGRLLMHLVHNNICQGASFVQNGMKRYTFLPYHSVETCRRWYASVATPEQAMKELHIDLRSYRVLLDASLLRSVAKIDSRHWHQRSDLADLCRHLDKVSQPCLPNTNELYPLLGEWLFVEARPRAISHELLQELFGGKVPVFRQLREPGLSAYYVDRTALERIHKLWCIHKVRRRHQGDSSCQLSLLAA
jgi:TniQ